MFPSMNQFTLLISLSALAAIPVTRAATIEVTVGGPGLLKFQPDTVNANVGDIVRFTFQQKNHTVTQSTLASPCSPMDGGFDSGFVPVADGSTDFPVAELEVHDATPQWVYCRQGNHCAQGMVFAVNPGEKMEQFRSAALATAAQSGSPYGAAPSSSPPAAPAATTSAAVVPPAPSSAVAAPPAAPSTTPTDHRIIVGGPGKLLFDPSNITATVGDTVTFEFRQKSHSVTQSSFGVPCQPLSQTNTSAQSFDSGLMPVADSVTGNFPTYTVTVNDTTPIWGYCKAATHCMQGMVFSINAKEDTANTFAAYKAKALASSTNTTSSNTTEPVGGSAGQPNGAGHSLISRDAGIAMTLGGLLLGAFLL